MKIKAQPRLLLLLLTFAMLAATVKHPSDSPRPYQSVPKRLFFIATFTSARQTHWTQLSGSTQFSSKKITQDRVTINFYNDLCTITNTRSKVKTVDSVYLGGSGGYGGQDLLMRSPGKIDIDAFESRSMKITRYKFQAHKGSAIPDTIKAVTLYQGLKIVTKPMLGAAPVPY